MSRIRGYKERMVRDTRLSDVLHVLLHMGRTDQPQTSELLAQSMGTNPAVFRRTMSGLREAGIVRSGRGNGGGWQLVRPLAEIRLSDVYLALGQPNLFAIGNRDRPSGCLIERSVNAAMADTMSAAKALFLERFDEVTLDMLMPALAAGEVEQFHNHPRSSAHKG